jgi:hypothetical protein
MATTRRQLLTRSSLSAVAMMAWPGPAQAQWHKKHTPTPKRHNAGVARAAVNVLYDEPGTLAQAIADLPNVSRSPFGVILPYGIAGTDTLPYADAAKRSGVRVLWDVRGLTPATDPQLLAQLDAHPSTFGFYVAEEPQDRASVETIVRLLGPRSHPRICTLFAYDQSDVSGRLAPLLGLTDLITCAAYPVGVQMVDNGPSDLPLSTVGDIAAVMSAAGKRHGFQPAMTLQAFSWGQDATLALTPDFARWPTRPEMTTMRQEALGGGVQVLFWFTRWAVRGASDPAGRWADVCAAAAGNA